MILMINIMAFLSPKLPVAEMNVLLGCYDFPEFVVQILPTTALRIKWSGDSSVS